MVMFSAVYPSNWLGEYGEYSSYLSTQDAVLMLQAKKGDRCSIDVTSGSWKVVDSTGAASMIGSWPNEYVALQLVGVTLKSSIVFDCVLYYSVTCGSSTVLLLNKEGWQIPKRVAMMSVFWLST